MYCIFEYNVYIIYSDWLIFIDTIVSSRVNIQLNPKKIATKGFLTDSDNIWCQK